MNAHQSHHAHQAAADPLADQAKVRLAEVAGMAKHKFTDLERELWERLIETYGGQAILAFLADYALNGSGFAPRPSDAQKMLNPGNGDSQVAFSMLVQAVKTVGSWETPTVLNDNPVLVAAVHQLGGWAHICNTLPDPIGNRYEFEGFQKQFDAAFRLASSRVKIHAERPKPLLGAVKEAAKRVMWIPPDASAAQLQHYRAAMAAFPQLSHNGGADAANFADVINTESRRSGDVEGRGA